MAEIKKKAENSLAVVIGSPLQEITVNFEYLPILLRIKCNRAEDLIVGQVVAVSGKVMALSGEKKIGTKFGKKGQGRWSYSRRGRFGKGVFLG